MIYRQQPLASRLRSLFAAALLAVAISPASATAGDTRVLVANGGGEYTPTIASFSDMRFKSVVRQRYDYSCGSAALATLLKFHYGLDTDEMSILKAMYETGDQQKIISEGFSLLDMKKYLASIGLRAEGYKVPLDKLSRVGIPAIVLINHRGYLHFVVVKGVSKEKVLVGDPTRGLRVWARKDFEPMWTGILFVVTDMKATARMTFNDAKVWARHTPELRDRSIASQDVSSFTLSASPTPNYY